MKTLRVFFAIDLPLDVKESLKHLQKTLQHENPTLAIQWIRPENLHVTLQFIPALKETDWPRLLENAKTHIQQCTFHLTLEKIELFPSSVDPKLITIKVGPHEILANLANILGQEITNLNYPIDSRPFRGHLTLGKIATSGGHALSRFAHPTFITKVPVTHVTLYRSQLDKEGSFYSVLGTIQL